MVQIRITNFTKEEAYLLTAEFTELSQRIMSYGKCKGMCNECKVKKLCKDVNATTNYLITNAQQDFPSIKD